MIYFASALRVVWASQQKGVTCYTGITIDIHLSAKIHEYVV